MIKNDTKTIATFFTKWIFFQWFHLVFEHSNSQWTTIFLSLLGNYEYIEHIVSWQL